MVDILDFLEYVLPSVCTINRGIPVLCSMIGVLKKVEVIWPIISLGLKLHCNSLVLSFWSFSPQRSDDWKEIIDRAKAETETETTDPKKSPCAALKVVGKVSEWDKQDGKITLLCVCACDVGLNISPPRTWYLKSRLQITYLSQLRQQKPSNDILLTGLVWATHAKYASTRSRSKQNIGGKFLKWTSYMPSAHCTVSILCAYEALLYFYDLSKLETIQS